MTRAMFFGGIGAVCASILLAGAMSRRERPAPPEQVLLMEAWQAYATPGVEHAMLARKVGTWTLRIRSWSEPGVEPEVSYGTSEFSAVMGGRFLLERVEGDAAGRPFSGIGLLGYDNLTARFVGIRTSSMGTGILRYEGDLGKDPATIVMTGQRPDVVARRYVPTQMTERRIDEDSFVLTIRETSPGGAEHTMRELTYTRR